MATEKKKSIFREYAEALMWALFFALLVRSFLIQPFQIPSESMRETLLVGDYLFATKFEYGLKIPFTDIKIFDGRDPERGEVVIFEYPMNPSMDFIKRIIGIPGDVIEIRNKQLYRNGELVKEDYIQFTEPNLFVPVRDNYGPVTVPKDKYFVMGDNRDNSMDSRFWGFVDKNAIFAHPWRIFWSFKGSARWDRIGQKIK